MAPELRHNPTRCLVLLFPLFILPIALNVNSECDRTFVSRPNTPQNGTFEAPIFLNLEGHSRQCIYTFLAAPHQRVQIEFTLFNLRGTPPECVHEWLDIYSEVQQPEAAELINSPFGGRYCGPIPPRRRISLYRSIVLGFYTDKNSSFPQIFAGRYTFIDDSDYQIGTPAPHTPCTFTVHANIKRQGMISSPTYPGAYPKNLSCSYLFLGAPSQRVRLEFRDFDLFYGGPHCPFDVVKVYDGNSSESAVIGTYCGQQRNLVLYSSETMMYVTFDTLQRTANTQNRGFKGIFEFSESFVKLDFIVKHEGEHIRGSECDQKILSKKESKGFVYSPNYPFPYIPKIVCRYFIYGMQDAQNLERVKLVFSMFEIPRGNKPDCTDGYLKIYLKGQEATDSYDKFDYELCGDDGPPAEVLSDGPRLVLVFSSGELQGRGFKANYTFETEYRIPGTPAPDGSCTFTYRSVSKKKGEFNSPRYPSNYPSRTNCSYTFIATPNEQVTIVFDHFKVRADNSNATSGSYGMTVCQEDWLEIYNLYRDGNHKLIGRYCGLSAPGPLESNLGATGIKVVLHSDHEGVYSGFRARYTFEVAKSLYGDCGNNVSVNDFGVITSPNFPLNYEGPARGMASRTCNWYINVRPKNRVMINFEQFAVEGEPKGRGCPASVVRVWNSDHKPPIEICGEKTTTDKWQYISESNSLRISFTSADKSVGALGFRAIWTEILSAEPTCTEFQCTESNLCIADKLRCNRISNCGEDDRSDEENCLLDSNMDWVWSSPMAIAIISGVVFVMLVCIGCRRRHCTSHRHRHRHLGRLHMPTSPASQHQQHVCDELGQRFASVDSV